MLCVIDSLRGFVRLQSSLYSMAQLVLAYFWGVVSDRVGRKKLIIMSNFFSTVSMLCFGLAGYYTVAALARILGGACVSRPSHLQGNNMNGMAIMINRCCILLGIPQKFNGVCQSLKSQSLAV